VVANSTGVELVNAKGILQSRKIPPSHPEYKNLQNAALRKQLEIERDKRGDASGIAHEFGEENAALQKEVERAEEGNSRPSSP
jgi:hypothetical protein